MSQMVIRWNANCVPGMTGIDLTVTCDAEDAVKTASWIKENVAKYSPMKDMMFILKTVFSQSGLLGDKCPGFSFLILITLVVA